MAFKRDIINTVATIGGAEVAGQVAQAVGGGNGLITVARFAGGYAGNLVCAGKSQDELKDMIRDRTVNRLLAAGYTVEHAEQAFDANFEKVEFKSNFWRNFGNQMTTILGGAFGLLTSSALFSGSVRRMGAPGLAIPIIGWLAGGYVGNKAWNKPSEKMLNEATGHVVTRILAQKQKAESQTFVEQVTAQGAGKERPSTFTEQVTGQKQNVPERQI